MKNAKLKIILTNIVTILMVLSPLLTFAQNDDEPCNATDPDAVCPIDTYVWILFAAALIIGVFFLYKKQRVQHSNPRA